jgi:hypothetical protein
MKLGTTMGPSGQLSAKKMAPPKAPLSWRLNNMTRPDYVWGLLANKAAKGLSYFTGIPTMTAELKIRLLKANGAVIDYGTVGHRVVTTAFVDYMVDQMQTETSTWGDFKYHDSGVGTTAAAIGDTDMETTDGESRATGTQTEGASANIYRSVGTISYTTTKAITEHGLFNNTTGATLLDRTVFSAINVTNGDSIQFTYDLTVSSGG